MENILTSQNIDLFITSGLFFGCVYYFINTTTHNIRTFHTIIALEYEISNLDFRVKKLEDLLDKNRRTKV